MQGWDPGGQDHWLARETVNAMRAARPTVTFVSFPELAILHHGVPPARAAGTERVILHGLDADIGRIVQESKHEGTYKSTIFVVTAGRAFEPIRTRMSFSHLSNAIVAAGGEATYLAGDGSALIGLRDPLQAQPVAQALQAESSSSIDAVYFKAQSGNAWSYQAQYLDPLMSTAFAHVSAYLLSTMASSAAPDVVVVYRPYAALSSTGKNAAPTGSVGLQWPIQHVPLILAGHGVYAGRTSSYPARLVDIAPTLETALGLPLGSHDGIVLRDAMYGNTSGRGAQIAEGARLAPLTSALQNRAASLAK
jgi:arylsulfatase A-like enzyme